MFTRRVFAGCAIALLAARGVAQEHQHGKGEKLGAVHFATSCNSEAQKEFDRAVALLHSFQFSHAIQGFNAALKSDPTCGIAYWGIALSQWSNPFAAGMKDNSQLQAGRESAERGKAAGAKTERERAYIAAVASLYSNFESTPQQARLLAYRDAMEGLASKYSDDQEAQIFYALALAAAEEPTDKTYAARLKAGAILNPVNPALGLNATISNTPYGVTAEAMEPCQANFVRREDFLQFLRQNNDAIFNVTRHLSRHYENAYAQIRSLGLSQSVGEKLAKLLLDWSTEAGEETIDGFSFKRTLTHEEIARMIGTTRETISRTFGDFAGKKIIDVKGATLTIRDRMALQALAGA